MNRCDKRILKEAGLTRQQIRAVRDAPQIVAMYREFHDAQTVTVVELDATYREPTP